MPIQRFRIIALLALPAVSLHAQWTSVHASEKTTETIKAPDGKVRTSTTSGEYYRSENGSELTVLSAMTPDGMLAKKTAQLYDSQSPAQYALDYPDRTAYLIARLPAAKPFQTNRAAQYPGLQHATYAGIDCLLMPIMMEKQRIGTVWVDDKDDLTLRTEVTLPGSHEVTELSDVSFNQHLDPSLFVVPAGFTVNTSKSKPAPAGQ